MSNDVEESLNRVEAPDILVDMKRSWQANSFNQISISLMLLLMHCLRFFSCSAVSNIFEQCVYLLCHRILFYVVLRNADSFSRYPHLHSEDLAFAFATNSSFFLHCGQRAFVTRDTFLR